MERLHLILIIGIGILSIGSIILSVISLTRIDDTSNLNVINEDGNTTTIREWLKSQDAIVVLSKAIQKSPFANNLIYKNITYMATADGGTHGFYIASQNGGPCDRKQYSDDFSPPLHCCEVGRDDYKCLQNPSTQIQSCLCAAGSLLVSFR